MSQTPKNDRLPSQPAAPSRYVDEEAADYPNTRESNRQRSTTRESRMDDLEKADEYYGGLSDERNSGRE